MKDLRITFWGVQGSCPIFLGQHELAEYARQVATYTLNEMIEDIERLEPSSRTPMERILGGPATHEAINEYQGKLGLPTLPFYGGDTTCIEIETSEGNTLLLDGGSGIRHCSVDIVKRWEDHKDRVLHVFGSHEHLDHRSGLPFASFCLLKTNPFDLRIYGHYNFLKALDDRFGIFSRTLGELVHQDDPLDYTIMPARFTGTEVRELGARGASPDNVPWHVHDMDEPVMIGQTAVRAFPVYHGPTPCLAYKISHGDATFVFCTDHEPRQGLDPDDYRQKTANAAEARLCEHSRNVDVMYVDGQFFKAEYMGLRGIGESPPVSRIDWGHGIIETNIERSLTCGVKRTYIGHHDPGREWPERVQIDRQLESLSRKEGAFIELAKGGTVLDL